MLGQLFVRVDYGAEWFCNIYNKMARRAKNVRESGKLSLSSYFKKIEDGSDVALVSNQSVKTSYPSRMNGKSGRVIGSRGKAKLVEIKDGNKVKTIIVHPIHLKKL